MSNVSLKEQLQAIAPQITDKMVGNAGNQHKSKVKPAPSTAHKTAKPKPKWLEHAQYGVELLKAYFPESFRSINRVVPLKKGIKQDLVKRLSTMDTIVTEDKACMVKSLSYYVNTLSYHKSVIVGATRVDLDGQACGVVTEEEATYSKERQQLKAKMKAQANPATATVS